MPKISKVALVGVDADRTRALAQHLNVAGLTPVCFTPSMWCRWPLIGAPRVVWARGLDAEQLAAVLGPAPCRRNTLIVQDPDRPCGVALRHAQVVSFEGDLAALGRCVRAWLCSDRADRAIATPTRSAPLAARAEPTVLVPRERPPTARVGLALGLALGAGLIAIAVAWPASAGTPRVVLPIEPPTAALAVAPRAPAESPASTGER